jgi:hypothetical protein
LENGETKRWNHLHCTVPSAHIVDSINEYQGSIHSTMGVFQRGLDELKIDALDAVIRLIKQKSIYRGAEFLQDITAFKSLLVKYNTLTEQRDKNIFIWSHVKNRAIRFKNSVIGTLVQDISNDIGLDIAVRSFESKVAPTNYKRTTAIISESMIKDAVKTIRKLDIESSLKRRFAVTSDITINNVLFADRSITPLMKDSLTDLLMMEVKPNHKLTQVNEIGIEDFITNLLPNITTLELKIPNDVNKLVSLTAPIDENSAPIFKWDNNFAWSYNGNITDSIKERIKKAGGNIHAKLMVRLSWYNTDDLDIHVIEPDGNHIFYNNLVLI